MLQTNKFQGCCLYDKLIKDQSIYAAIYALKNTLGEKYLMSENDIKELTRLQDHFESNSKFIEDCKSCLIDMLNGEDFFEVEIFFKFKKLKADNSSDYRPIHSTNLITHVCLLVLANNLIFIDDLEDGGRSLSSLSQLIPPNFYGNIPSTEIKNLYKPWATQYKIFTQNTIERSKEYKETRQYTTEISLDIQNFYPNINPFQLFDTISKKYRTKYTGIEMDCFKRILELLLFFKIQGSFSKDEKEIYYGAHSNIGEDTLFVRGLPQGLPHAYYLGNIAMIEVASIIEDFFPGDAYYYVDDSVIFSKCKPEEFDKQIEKLNEKLKEAESPSLDWFNNYRSVNLLKEFCEKNISYNIRVHEGSGKSSIISLDEAPVNLSNLFILAKPASALPFAIKATLNEINDEILLSQIEILLETINKELSYIDSIQKAESNPEGTHYEAYKKRLKSYRKFYLFRKSLLLEKLDDTDNNPSKNPLDNVFKEYNELSRTELSEKIDNDIFQTTYRLLLSSSFDRDDINKIVSNVEKKLKGDDVKISDNHLYYLQDAKGYKFSKTIQNDYPKDKGLFEHIRSAQIKSVRNCGFKTQLVALNRIMDKQSTNELLDKNNPQYFVYLSDTTYQRNLLNGFFSYVMDVSFGDTNQYLKKGNRTLYWYELRILHWLRLPNFDFISFRSFVERLLKEVQTGRHISKIDYDIIEVLPIFRMYVRKQEWNDALIQIHEYVNNLWKNGAKFLHFFTLHNEDHSIELIKKSLDIKIAFSYLSLKELDFYILFLSCYLHDISMVLYPNCHDFIRNDNVKSNKEKEKTDLSEREIILNHYFQVDEYFESQIRTTHPRASAKFIVESPDLNFIESSIRGLVASVCKSHGVDTSEIYGRRSTAKESIVSEKYLMIILRLADLLDMSQERISPVILSKDFLYMSPISRFHWISHAGINHCDLTASYSIGERKPNSSWLSSGSIQENISLLIHLNANNKITFDSETFCYNRDMIVIPEKDIYSLKMNKGVCSFQKTGGCPLVCRWMKEKNEYLYKEFYAFQKYLTSNPGHHYATNIQVDLKLGNSNLLNNKYIHFISEYLNKK